MNLNIKAVEGCEEVISEFYTNHGNFHNGDSGLDLYAPQDLLVPARGYSIKMPLGICAEAFIDGKPCSFYLYPRSSTGLRTPLRLSNSVGIIDSGYRGELAAILDNVSDEPFMVQRGERYFQICAPDLTPIDYKLVSELSESSRGTGGFGSTGK